MMLHMPRCIAIQQQVGQRSNRQDRAPVRVVAGKKAKLRKAKQELKTKELPAGSEATTFSEKIESVVQTPMLPGEALGTLSDFAVASETEAPLSRGTSDTQDESPPSTPAARGATSIQDTTNDKEEASARNYSDLGKLLIWVFTLMIGIGAFYGVVFAASGGISSFLKDRVTFTRKDFIPYSERRRMEAELKEKEDAERAVREESVDSRPGAMSKDLLELLPAPPK